LNDNDPILTELRKITAWTDMQRKITKWPLIVVAVIIPAMIVVGVVVEHRLRTSIEDITTPETRDWYDVDRNVRLGDFDEAIRIGEELILKTPQYPDGHRGLGAAYLAAGETAKAREHYAEAARLFPSEENEKALMAIERRIEAEKPQPAGPPNSAPPSR